MRPLSAIHRRSIAATLAAGLLALAPAFAGAQAGGTATKPAVKPATKPAAKPAPKSNALEYGPAPDVFPAGARMAVVSGDPSKSGPYVVRLSMPNAYRIAPHFHPTDEHIRVRSGNFLVGMGDALDLRKAKRLAAGDTITAPAQMHHYAGTRGRTVVEVSGTGPFQLTYVNPNDMPKPKAVSKR